MTVGWFVMLLIIVGHLLRIAYGDSPPADDDDGAPWS